MGTTVKTCTAHLAYERAHGVGILGDRHARVAAAGPTGLVDDAKASCHRVGKSVAGAEDADAGDAVEALQHGRIFAQRGDERFRIYCAIGHLLGRIGEPFERLWADRWRATHRTERAVRACARRCR